MGVPSNENATQGPLSGVRVLDLTSLFMGPTATQILGDFGAEVIKVEPPEGDVVRAIGPHGERRMGPMFLNVNRNKRSIVLDLKTEPGHQALLRLVTQADILIYNVRPAAMARLRLAYEDLRQVNPRIIYVGTFGFSPRGRYAPEAAVDDAIQAAVALPHAAMMNGSDVPRYAPVNIVDRSVGIYAMGVVCAALYARERTGLGQAIDVPMFETMAHYVLSEHLYGHTFIPAEDDFGYPRIVNAYRRPYKTKDGYICAVVYTDAQWKSFLSLVGKAELFAGDPRFKDMTSRNQHVEELYKLVSDELEQRTNAEWREALIPLGIPVFAMNTFESLLQDPHLAEIGFFQEVDHPSEGRVRIMACPTEWSATPPAIRRHAPRLGEHSREILTEAGYTTAEIDTMIAAGVTREAD
jgi:crotonobetainyl-CoA:carnitine CoA-transferase CaiB-like acyl-CoA transferase